MSALTAWTDAERACFNYIIANTNSKEGEKAFLGDALPAYDLNVWAFHLSGGGVQGQNFQTIRPSSTWFCDGQLIGQFQERETAMNFAGMLMNQLPAYANDNNTGSCAGTANRGISPNVNLFEMTTFPSIDSRPLLVNAKDDIEITVWMLTMQFRCQFSNVQN